LLGSSGAACDYPAKISIFGGFLLSVRRGPDVSAILRQLIFALVFSLPPYCADAFLPAVIWRV
jgi:hypothetical protein